MAKKVYRTATGAWRETDERDFDAYLLSRGDYDNLILKVSHYQTEYNKLKQETATQLRNAKGRADLEIQNIRDECDRLLDERDAEIRFMNLDLEAQIQKNENLKRIARERANADRKLQPKKKRCGYVLLSLEEAFYRYEYTDKGHKKSQYLDCWKVRLQTPWEALLPFNVVRQSVWEDFPKFLLKLLDQEVVYRDIMDIESFPDVWNGEESFCFNPKYKLTSRGYWEVEFFCRYVPTVDIDLLDNK